MSYVVMAEFRARKECIAEFGAFIDGHATFSRMEPGCLTFDVSQDAEDEALFLFYEVYTDEQAYQAHRAMPYHPRFFEMAAPLLEPQGDSLFLSRRVLARRDAPGSP